MKVIGIFGPIGAGKSFIRKIFEEKGFSTIDADEVVTPELALEIKKAVAESGPYEGYLIRRRNHFLGRPLRFGSQGRERILRLFRKKSGRFVGIVHEIVHIEGLVGTLKNTLEHYGTETLDDYYIKLKLYTDLEATRIISRKHSRSLLRAIFFPPARWVLDYIFLGGFLDGRIGLLYHGLSCYYGWLKNLKAFYKANPTY